MERGGPGLPLRTLAKSEGPGEHSPGPFALPLYRPLLSVAHMGEVVQGEVVVFVLVFDEL